MLAGFLFLLLLTDGVSSERNCSYQDVVDYLNLTNNKDLFSLTRPVKNYKQPTEVTLDVLLYGILDVHEKDQKLVSYVWIDMWWKNEFIAWDPEEFCGIKSFSFPAEFLWKPDITIHEMTEKDKGPRSPYLIVENTGDVVLTDDQVLSTTCRMHVHKFPFDIQSCSLTFKSIVHTVNEILLVKYHDSKKTTEFTHQLIQTQYEWLFIDMRVTNTCINQFDFQQSTIVYTITMGRKSALYIVNFLLPVMFFLILDLASFLISDSGGEKESNSQLRVESHDFEKLSDELMEALKTLTVVLNNRKEEQKPGYWTRIAKTINKVFFICYVIATTAFLKNGVSSERNCSYQDVVDYLNLTNNKDLFSLTRPVKNYKQPTEVELVVALYGILDVREKDQKLVPYVWIDMWWKNEFIAWDPEEFCGIQSFSFPAEFLWKPDITIHEMTEKDMGPRSPYLTVHSDGYIGTADDKVLISTCRMRIFKFPFDIQSCNLTFKSVSHTDDEIHLTAFEL
ncbi:5-hydroxytryptamine receptor 3A [Larimichthys crocea]|uniref:5-hydroxytryptamine receptor 3A n=1 Tax=Larimichthys crocea TaxID=215358 RepID=A0A6G0HXV3_LARCR|nr:5-hydroxytryptamine receptor 3A [Larimichthys crocea]